MTSKSSTVYPIIKKHVLPQSMIYTDEFPDYDKLNKQGYHHKRVHHASKVWVMGNVHTNTIEGFWSVLKRGINGVYHAVSEKYLQNYIDEYAFRYNHRKDETTYVFDDFGQDLGFVEQAFFSKASMSCLVVSNLPLSISLTLGIYYTPNIIVYHPYQIQCYNRVGGSQMRKQYSFYCQLIR